MVEENKEKKFEILKYIGKELKRDGGEWKIFRLKFDAGRQYPFSIDAFDSIGNKEDSKSLSLKDLAEGEYYTVGYTIEKEAFEAHGKKHNNRLVFFIRKSSKEESEKQTSAILKNSGKKEEEGLDLKSVAEFLYSYNEQVKDEDKNLTHLFMVWFKNRHKDEADKLLPIFEAYLNKQVKK